MVSVSVSVSVAEALTQGVFLEGREDRGFVVGAAILGQEGVEGLEEFGVGHALHALDDGALDDGFEGGMVVGGRGGRVREGWGGEEEEDEEGGGDGHGEEERSGAREGVGGGGVV